MARPGLVAALKEALRADARSPAERAPLVLSPPLVLVRRALEPARAAQRLVSWPWQLEVILLARALLDGDRAPRCRQPWPRCWRSCGCGCGGAQRGEPQLTAHPRASRRERPPRRVRKAGERSPGAKKEVLADGARGAT